MRTNVMLIMIGMVSLGPACGGSGTEEDLCAAIECDDPPADACQDATLLLDYPSAGSCDPATGTCSYPVEEVTCEHGCAAGRCLEADPCRGVVCDDPPANICADASTLMVYQTVGECDDAGECAYSASERHCVHGCEDGTCVNQDLCVGVVCDTPPADTCKDLQTLIVYEASGTCEPATGRCEYGSDEQPCDHGCDAGRCLSDREAWGWISVYELNDARMNADWGWTGGVRAYLAEAAHCRRALEHDKPLICASLVASAGSCSLYESEWQDRWLCDPPCEWEQQECVTEDQVHLCRDLPRHWDAGAIEAEGPGWTATLQADDLGRYAATDVPAELFGAGDTVRVDAGGGDLGAFTLSAAGVAHLEIPDPDVRLTGGQAVTVPWVPGDPGSRVQIMLFSGPHHPSPPVAAILCDAPDEDGQVEIAAELVDGFLERNWVTNWFSQALRYRSATADPFGETIELRVGSMRHLNVLWR